VTSLRVGEALIRLLEQEGVDTVFGIPGVHTVELYRGLHGSAIRHVTPRHEQGAAFMADGYARVTGKPGVCLLITGPGFTNALTAIAQARADSIPMLIISGVNARESLGRQQGLLHELPDQAALSRTVCLDTHTVQEPAELASVVAQAFATMTSGRPGPVHIEIPIDVMAMPAAMPATSAAAERVPILPTSGDLDQAVSMAGAARTPLILAGGGMKDSETLRRLATILDAPVISTNNARGLMAGHPLNLPASASLKTIRTLIGGADLVLALGTEIGETDYDFFGLGPIANHPNMIRVDIDGTQFEHRGDRGLMIKADAKATAAALAERVLPKSLGGAERTARAREAAWQEIPADYRASIDLLHRIWRDQPDALIVGDSTQAIYAGMLYLDVPRPGAWFHSATGYGTLGYAAPAAIGAALAAPDRPVICLIGDGGLQFTLAELGSAVDAKAPVIFLVWNNAGYREIETSMVKAGIAPIGVKPSAPDFVAVAEAYGLSASWINDPGEIVSAVSKAINQAPGPHLIDVITP